ncbi:MAG: LuxR C-terminal-related transcriptional regulator [Aeromicrobium sp.]
MHPVALVDIVVRGLTHDAEEALERLLREGDADDESVLAGATFLRVLTCRFDEALDTALVLTTSDDRPSLLAKAAADLAIAVCAGLPASDLDADTGDGPLAELTAMLEVEAAMSSGLIDVASRIAGRIVSRHGVRTATGTWSALALARARGFEGRLVEADELVDRVLSAAETRTRPQLHLLAQGARIFVDGHLGRSDAVEAGVDTLLDECPDVVEHDYVLAGALVLAAFGTNASGRLPEASELILLGGGGEHLPHLQIVDRVYGYEMLVEDALARQDLAAAHDWAEHAEGLPVAGHPLAAAALGRIRARVALALADTDSGIRESAGSGRLAALVGSDLEVIRARVIESSARAASGDRVRGIEELEEVARRAGEVGAASVKAWVDRELRAYGRRLRNVPGHGWDGLTEPQQAIARLAAAGLRNREIAAAMWIAEKTVESHVAAVLTALGTTNRVGIGRVLGGTGVDPQFGRDLTARQREVAVLVAGGRSNQEISVELGISEKTVEKHVAGLFDRLGVRTRAAIAACVRGEPLEP